MALSSIQKGNIVESQVANLLILLSDGELTPSIPIVDDHGVDLIVGAKGTFNAIFLQVKSRFVTNSRFRNRLDFQVQKDSLQKSPKLFVVCVYFDKATGAIDTMWLIPSASVLDGAVRLEKHYRVVASRGRGSRDKWSRFRITPQDLSDELLKRLKGRR